MEEKKAPKWAELWARARPYLLHLIQLIGLYLDDLLMVAAGVCFVTAAAQLGGRPAALMVAGVCMLAYAIVVARARTVNHK